MKNFVRSLALVLVLVMCCGMLSACDKEPDAESTKPSATTPSGTTAPAHKDIVGIITEISDTFIVLDTYRQDQNTVDYTKLDLQTLELSGESDYVYLNTTALYGFFVQDKVETLKKGNLSIGDIVVVTKNAKGTQQIVIMNYKTTTPTTPTVATGGTQ